MEDKSTDKKMQDALKKRNKELKRKCKKHNVPQVVNTFSWERSNDRRD